MTNIKSRTRIDCFECTHTWTIENWKNWLKVNNSKPNKNTNTYSALYSGRFTLPFTGEDGAVKITTWQMKAFPEKDIKGRKRLKLKLVSHNGPAVIPPGTYSIKSAEALFSFHNLNWFGFHWDDRNLDNLKAQFPVPYRWSKKNLEIELNIKLFVPVNESVCSDKDINGNKYTAFDRKIQAILYGNSRRALSKPNSTKTGSNLSSIGGSKETSQESLSTPDRKARNNCNRRDSSSSDNDLPTAPSLMEPI